MFKLETNKQSTSILHAFKLVMTEFASKSGDCRAPLHNMMLDADRKSSSFIVQVILVMLPLVLMTILLFVLRIGVIQLCHKCLTPAHPTSII